MSNRIATSRQLILETAEGVVFSYELASPLTRGLAITVDLLIIGSVNAILNGILAAFAFLSVDIAIMLGTLGSFILSLGYGMYFEARHGGQTPGKKLFRLRVIDVEGRRLRPHQAVLRNLVRVVDQMPLFYLVGGISATLSSRNQRLGDIAAGTVVIQERPPLIRATSSSMDTKAMNSLRQYPALVRRLRQALTPQEYQTATEAIARRDQLEPAARLEIFRELADHFRTIAKFPPDAIEGIADERLVRNVVEVVSEGR